MKTLASTLLLFAVAAVLPLQAQTVTGTWSGEADVKDQQVPVILQIAGDPAHLTAALVNGPERSAATSTVLTGKHLVLTFDYFARTLDATLSGDTLTGTFGLTAPNAPLIPVTLKLAPSSPVHSASQLAIDGDWEIAVHTAKGESAWQLRIDAKTGQPYQAVIQRIDGDTGSLFGSYDTASKSVRFSHFTAAGPALYSVAPQADGTLLVSNLLNDKQTDLVARRPTEARKENLPTLADPTRQTTIKDPAAPFQFSFPDLSGKLVTNADPRFDGKVVIVAVGGSWCPNCHDEAPFLESLYKRFHTRGLEIVDLSFEEADQLKDPARLRAFIARYGLSYPVLVAGEPEQLTSKIPQADNLNCWPTSFFLGRDGRVREVHAGFAGPANPPAHAELTTKVTALVEQLLAEPAPTHSASR